MIGSEHLGAAPAAMAQAIQYCIQQRSGSAHPVLIDLAGSSQDPIDYLCANGFSPIETAHELGMNVL